MRIFQGPLGDHCSYIEHIALPNCVDYFDLVKKQKERNENSVAAGFERLRYFLNAMESLNNILDYYYHDNKEGKDWRDQSLIVGKIRNSFIILRDIEQIANAYKHCIRRNEGNYNASDLQSTIFEIIPSDNYVDVYYEYSSIEDEAILKDAFQFWQKYLDKPEDLNISEST